MSSSLLLYFFSFLDALHLSIPAQGLPNGEAAMQHPAAAFQAMQPGYGVSGVGKYLQNLLLYYMYL